MRERKRRERCTEKNKIAVKVSHSGKAPYGINSSSQRTTDIHLHPHTYTHTPHPNPHPGLVPGVLLYYDVDGSPRRCRRESAVFYYHPPRGPLSSSSIPVITERQWQPAARRSVVFRLMTVRAVEIGGGHEASAAEFTVTRKEAVV